MHRPRRLVARTRLDPRCRHIFRGFARIAARRRKQCGLADASARGVLWPLAAPTAAVVRAPNRMHARAYRNRIFLGARCRIFVAMTRGTRAFARAARRESKNRSV